MPPNKQSRKQRFTRGKNNVSRERTILTLAEDSASAPNYMLPTQPPFPPNLGNVFSQFHQPSAQQQQQPGISVSDVPSFHFGAQQPNLMHTFGQGPNFLRHMQQPFQHQNQNMPPPQQQHQQRNSSEESDIEKLRRLKETILNGQHPFFQAVPKPDALASLFLGPHPASQVYQQQNHQQSVQPGPDADSQSQSHSKSEISGSHKPDLSHTAGNTPASNSARRSETPNSSSGFDVSKTSGSPSKSQSVPLAAPLPPGLSQTRGTLNSVVSDTHNGGVGDNPHSNVTVPPKTLDFRTNTRSPLSPIDLKSSMASQQHQHDPLPATSSSGAEAHVPHSPSALSPSMSLNDAPGAHKPLSSANDAKNGSTALRESHQDPPPSVYDRDRDRERPGYSPYDSSRYSQMSDRRDSGRYATRYYDRDRDWDRGRDWARDWEKERYRDREKDRQKDPERDRDKEKARDHGQIGNNISENQGLEYGSLPPARSQLERGLLRTEVEQKSLLTSNQRPVPGLGLPLEHRRSEVPAHPDQRRSNTPPYTEQHHRPEPVTPRSVVATPSSSFDRRHDDDLTNSFPNQSPRDRDGSRANLGTTQARPSCSPTVVSHPSLSHRPEQLPNATSTPADNRSHLHAVSNHRPSPGNTSARPGFSTEHGRRTENLDSVTRSVVHPPFRRPEPPPDDHSTLRSMSERRLTHPGDPPAPPNTLVVAGSRHDTRDSSRSLYSHATAPPLPRTISRAPSPIPSYPPSRDRPNPSNYREQGPPTLAATSSHGYIENPRRQPSEVSASRRGSDCYSGSSAPPPVPPIVERREHDALQWREREGYQTNVYPDTEREHPRRFPEPREWHNDTYARDRVPRSEVDSHSRGHTAPWDRDGSTADLRNKEKDRDRIPSWSAERKYVAPDVPRAPSPPPRWEEAPGQAQRPLQARPTDSYDDRFIPRDAAERGRYPSGPLTSNEDIIMRDSFRDNPRLRPRSPSPASRPFDDAHRAPKRAREEFVPRSPYYGDTRPPFVLRDPPPATYYTPRAPALGGGRDAPPYARDRGPEPYPRRDVPPPRSPPYYPRERYPPR